MSDENSARPARRRRGVVGVLTSAVSKLLAIPVIALATAVSVYIRTSPYQPTEALGHLVARAGCPAAAVIGLAGARDGEPGYHARNDPDGDGIACAPAAIETLPATPGQVITTKAGGAKFVRPKRESGG